MPSNVPSYSRSQPLDTPQFAPPAHPTIDVTRQPRPGDNQPEDRHVTTTVSRDLPFIIDNDFLQVTNDDSKPVEFAWARKRYVVAPGETTFVIFQAVVNKLGDPRSEEGAQISFDDGNGNRGKIMERYEYLKSLFAMYGVEMERIEDFTFTEGPRKGETIKGLMSVVPKLTVKTLAGQLVRFPAQDPKMMAYPVTNVGKRNVNSDTARMMQSLQAENDELRRRQAETEARLDAFFASQEGTDQPPSS